MKRKSWVWTSIILVLVVFGIGVLVNNQDKTTEEKDPLTCLPPPSPEVTTPDSSTPTPTAEHLPEPVTVPEIPSSPQISNEANQNDSPHPDDQIQSDVTNTPVAPVLQPEKENQQIEVPLTNPKSAEKPAEPPKPQPKEPEQPQSPDTPPTYEEKDVQPNKPANEPKAGDKNAEGKVYFPGFGWIDDSGPSQGSISESDGDWNKQVGTMD